MSSKTPLGRIRASCCERSGGCCEACGAHVGEDGELGHADHFWGRRNAAESAETIWILCVDCDHSKTTNSPSQSHWLLRFMLHSFEHEHVEQARRAAIRLSVLEQKFPDKHLGRNI